MICDSEGPRFPHKRCACSPARGKAYLDSRAPCLALRLAHCPRGPSYQIQILRKYYWSPRPCSCHSGCPVPSVARWCLRCHHQRLWQQHDAFKVTLLRLSNAVGTVQCALMRRWWRTHSHAYGKKVDTVHSVHCKVDRRTPWEKEPWQSPTLHGRYLSVFLLFGSSFLWTQPQMRKTTCASVPWRSSLPELCTASLAKLIVPKPMFKKY